MKSLIIDSLLHSIRQGDDGIDKDEDKANMYRKKTEEYVEKFGGFGFGGGMG